VGWVAAGGAGMGPGRAARPGQPLGARPPQVWRHAWRRRSQEGGMFVLCVLKEGGSRLRRHQCRRKIQPPLARPLGPCLCLRPRGPRAGELTAAANGRAVPERRGDSKRLGTSAGRRRRNRGAQSPACSPPSVITLCSDGRGRAGDTRNLGPPRSLRTTSIAASEGKPRKK